MEHYFTVHYLHRDRRFTSVRREFNKTHDLEESFRKAAEVIKTDVVLFGHVDEHFTGPYLKLMHGIQLIFESLFEIFPDGVGRIDVTEEGIMVRFVTRRGVQKVHTMINVGWEYSPGTTKDWEDDLQLFKETLAA